MHWQSTGASSSYVHKTKLRVVTALVLLDLGGAWRRNRDPTGYSILGRGDSTCYFLASILGDTNDLLHLSASRLIIVSLDIKKAFSQA